MVTMKSNLQKERKNLERIVRQVKKRISSYPEGQLRLSAKKNRIEYYIKSKGEKGNGRYLTKGEDALATEIIKRDYDMQVLSNAEERIKAIDSFLYRYGKTDIGEVYRRMHVCRRSMITPFVLPDEEYIKKWQSFEYKAKGFKEDAPEIITERGERVRSKSEKIIADKLYLLGIPYRYECPLMLEDHIEVYPDFTILNVITREEVYLEHFGMMDDLSYVEGVLFKLSTYERNGIYLGVNLFMTHETSKSPLNTKALDGMLKKLFCEEE